MNLHPRPTPAEIEIDSGVAHVARIYDYMLGGDSHFEADRRAAERAAEPMGGMPAVRHSTRSNRAFLARAVRYLAAEAGITQFLDLGSGIPAMDNVHEVAQRHRPDATIVYVDFSPTALAHAHERRSITDDGAVDYLILDIRDPDAVLEEAAKTLDFTQPIAVLMFTILHNIADDPWALVGRYMDAVPPDSYLAMSNLTGDFNPREMGSAKSALDEDMAEPFVLRTFDEIMSFFDGGELVEPGLVHINDWRPDDNIPPNPSGVPAPIYGGVARRPDYGPMSGHPRKV